MLWILLAAVVGLSCAENEGRKSYMGYQVLEMVPTTVEQVKYLHDLMLGDLFIDFWVEPSNVGEQVTMMVSPKQFRQVQVLLRKQGINFDTAIKDVEHSVLQPMWKELDSRRNEKGGLVFNIEDFNTIEDINAWLATTAANCPSSITCRVYSIGNSYNGRPLNVFHISKSGSGRRAYWIDATIHAREWIATATALKVLDNFARLADANAIRLTDEYDWYILPVMNPDGYAYTHTNDRLWRKNRRPNTGSTCYGTDLNRNFNFRWGTEGVSHSPCSETFCGPSGGSEPETQAVSAELNRLGPSLQATVTVHAYGNMWMFPWGNTVNHAGSVCDRSDDHNELMVVADATANAIQATFNTRWSRGNSCEVIYETTGGTDDYAKGVSGVKYAFCPELRGNNFVISASNITPSFQEFWNGVVAMTNTIP
jgi:carboxypeptidase A2